MAPVAGHEYIVYDENPSAAQQSAWYAGVHTFWQSSLMASVGRVLFYQTWFPDLGLGSSGKNAVFCLSLLVMYSTWWRVQTAV